MAPIARRCVPFTPFDGELSRASVALVTAAGVHRRDQPPFNIADELGDLTFRVIGADAAASDLMVTHHHYDHADADHDVNVVGMRALQKKVLRDALELLTGPPRPGEIVERAYPEYAAAG